jgi:hypothetical protein
MPACLPQWQLDEYTTRRAEIEALLVSLNAALASLIANPTVSYTLNTGQTSQQVTRQSIPALRAWVDDLRAERWQILEALNSTPRSGYFRPGF